jgi:hypothetical protein
LYQFVQTAASRCTIPIMGRRSRRADREPPRRERLGRERPGSVWHGPPISVTCECGAKRGLAYGERWTCDRCGREWDTTEIPRAEYDAVRHTQLRFRALPVGFGGLVAALAIFFSLTGNVFSVFFLLPLSLTTWFVFLRPAHRRRYREAIAELPRWDLHPR